MNRTVAEVAKVLGADVAQTKRWAANFADLLTPAARPPKGAPRVFTDDDVLVLVYVKANWTSPVDDDDIRRHIDDGRHREDAFLHHLYWHNPLFQDPPADLDETWRHGFILHGAGTPCYFELARTYRSVAEGLLETARKSGSPLDFAAPVLFAFRHALELYLKILGEIDETTHSLERCVVLVERRHHHKIGSPIRNWILELDRYDPAGTAFRYVGEPPASLRASELWLDLNQFAFAMSRTFRLLDTAILELRTSGRPVKKQKKKSAPLAGSPPG